MVFSLLKKFINKDKKKIEETSYDKISVLLNSWLLFPIEKLEKLNLDNNNNIIKFYYCPNISVIESFENKKEIDLTSNTYLMTFKINKTTYSDEYKYIFITGNEVNGIRHIVDFLSSDENGKNICKYSKNISDLLMLGYVLRKEELNEDIEEICENYNAEIKYFGIEVYYPMQIDKIIHGDPPKIYTIPYHKRASIRKITIHTNNNNEISSVNLDVLETEHPNCKDGWYCIGTFFGKKLNIENFKMLIESIKTINLNDSYYTPSYLMDLIQEEKKYLNEN